jgi:hypothetical protein
MLIEHNEINKLLGIAKRHLNYIKKSRTKENTISDLKIDHALVTSIFSAAAVELGLNIFISIRVLFIKNESLRRFFGVYVTKYSRLSIPQKINIISDFCPEIRENKHLCKRARELFEYRNSVLHSSPEYVEPWGLKEIPEEAMDELIEKDTFPRELTYDDLIPYPQLVWFRGASTSEVEEAFQNYNTAISFLKKLNICFEKFENYPSPFLPPEITPTFPPSK